MSDSRYIHIHQKRLPTRKKVVMLQGAFEDDGKYFKCWNCGSINSIDRNVGFDGNGISVKDITIASSKDTLAQFNELLTDNQKITIGFSGFEELVMLRNGLDGEAITTYYTERSAESVKGCWFCGSTNIY